MTQFILYVKRGESVNTDDAPAGSPRDARSRWADLQSDDESDVSERSEISHDVSDIATPGAVNSKNTIDHNLEDRSMAMHSENEEEYRAAEEIPGIPSYRSNTNQSRTTLIGR